MKLLNQILTVAIGLVGVGQIMGQDMDVQGDGSNGSIILQGKNINPSLGSNRIGVRGYSLPGAGYGIGVQGVGGNIGVDAIATSSGSPGNYNWALQATAGNSGKGNRAVQAIASGTNAIGVYAEAPTGATQWGVFCKGNMYVQGNITALGTITPSDLRLKKNVTSLPNSLAGIMSLKPKEYEYRTDEFNEMNLQSGRQMGLIAQDVERIYPELVTESVLPEGISSDENDASGKGQKAKQENFKGVNYIGLIPVLIGAIQEQEEQIKKLSAQIAKLKK